MASVKNLKKDIHNTLGDLIEACYLWEFTTEGADITKSQKIIDEAISSFDSLMDKIHLKDPSDFKAHFRSIRRELEKTALSLAEKINAL